MNRLFNFIYEDFEEEEESDDVNSKEEISDDDKEDDIPKYKSGRDKRGDDNFRVEDRLPAFDDFEMGDDYVNHDTDGDEDENFRPVDRPVPFLEEFKNNKI